MSFKKIILLMISIFTCFSLVSCKQETSEEIYESYADLNGKKIGIVTGSIYEESINEKMPDSEILFFSTLSDVIVALKEGKIDAGVTDKARAIDACNKNEDLSYFPDAICTLDYAYAFAKDEDGKKLSGEVSEFIRQGFNDGSLNLLVDKWLNNDCDEIIDYKSLENINGEFTVASDTTAYPFSFVLNNEITGFDIEFLYEFAKAYGYSFTIDTYDFSGMLSAVATGKNDVMGSSVMYTEERAKNLYFSDAYATGDGTMIVRKENVKSGINNISDLKGKTFGSILGNAASGYVEDLVEDVNIEYFGSTPDVYAALDSGKVDFSDIIEAQVNNVFNSHPNYKIIGTLYTEHYAYVFNKGQNLELQNEFNEYLTKIKADGTLDEIIDLWLNHADEASIDYTGIENNTKILRAATCSTIGEPFTYIKDNQFAGFENDILVRFAKEYGYNVVIDDYEFGSLLSAITTGKNDIGYCSITITEERRKNVDFSNVFYSSDMYLIALDNSYEEENVDLLATIKDKINSTFIKEDRYKLFLDGLYSTLSITILSAILGTILGIALFVLFRMNNVVMDKLLSLYTWLINGMPTVVILMVFFYIIFGSSSIDGKSVAIISFTIIFSVNVLGQLKTCFASIPVGQFDAARALGYNRIQTIIKIIIPQIMPILMPNYLSSIIDLMKSSSIVGYIAVQDLTKASDIIRSRTYDAFFPLIATTIIYFIIGSLLKLIISIIENKTNPKKRKSIALLEGVEKHD